MKKNIFGILKFLPLYLGRSTSDFVKKACPERENDVCRYLEPLGIFFW